MFCNGQNNSILDVWPDPRWLILVPNFGFLLTIGPNEIFAICHPIYQLPVLPSCMVVGFDSFLTLVANFCIQFWWYSKQILLQKTIFGLLSRILSLGTGYFRGKNLFNLDLA